MKMKSALLALALLSTGYSAHAESAFDSKATCMVSFSRVFLDATHSALDQQAPVSVDLVNAAGDPAARGSVTVKTSNNYEVRIKLTLMPGISSIVKGESALVAQSTFVQVDGDGPTGLDQQIASSDSVSSAVEFSRFSQDSLSVHSSLTNAKGVTLGLRTATPLTPYQAVKSGALEDGFAFGASVSCFVDRVKK